MTDLHQTWMVESASLSSRIFLGLGALSACCSVVFSAAFAHMPLFANGVPAMVQTALTQQQLHALGLMVVGLALALRPSVRLWMVAGWLMLMGLFLFSLNIYVRAIWGWDGARAFVPWGGGCWILSWLLLALGAFKAH